MDESCGAGMVPDLWILKMTHVSPTQITAPLGFLGAVEGLFAQALQNLRYRRDVRRTYNELSELTNRELLDLGIARCDIARIARESAL